MWQLDHSNLSILFSSAVFLSLDFVKKKNQNDNKTSFKTIRTNVKLFESVKYHLHFYAWSNCHLIGLVVICNLIVPKSYYQFAHATFYDRTRGQQKRISINPAVVLSQWHYYFHTAMITRISDIQMIWLVASVFLSPKHIDVDVLSILFSFYYQWGNRVVCVTFSVDTLDNDSVGTL